MPTLLSFFPCEKVVVDSTTNNVSISSILQQCSVVVPPELSPVPKGALIPMQWAVFAMWGLKAGEQHVPFEAKVEFISANGEMLIESPPHRQDFDNFTKTSQRLIIQVMGFPIWAPGECNLILKSKSEGSNDFAEVARFPVLIQHAAPTIN